MKKTFLIICIILLPIINTYSQLPESYPFKTFLDEEGFLYITGNIFNPLSNTFDILVQKYRDSVQIWSVKYFDPSGNDKGMDITIDRQGYPIITGYIYNVVNNCNNIIILKLNNVDGDSVWTKQYLNPRGDKGLGIAVDIKNDIYISGYITNKYLNKDFIVLKYLSNGDLVWKCQYDNPEYHSDDVSTDIVTDGSFAYAVGYTTGSRYLKDVMMLVFNLDNSVAEDTLIYRKAWTNEIPTGFVLTNIRDYRLKSRSSITCITDNSLNPHLGTDYLTLNFKGDDHTTLNWAKTFNGSGNGEDVPTAIVADKDGNTYVTGYSIRNSPGNYDFATIKYNRDSGVYGWSNHVEYFDHGQAGKTDKASSIKVWQNQIFVAGSCQNATSGYKIISYLQSPVGTIFNWDAEFHPSFAEGSSFNEMKKAAVLEVDSVSGKIWLIAFAWNETEQYMSFRTYDPDGNVISTVDNYQSDFSNDQQTKDQNNEEDQNSFSLSQNYPNPFNPSTVIRYNIPGQSNSYASVLIKVYDLAGKEVATLVNENQSAGSHSVTFDGSNLSSGIYYYKVESGVFSGVRRMILVK